MSRLSPILIFCFVISICSIYFPEVQAGGKKNCGVGGKPECATDKEEEVVVQSSKRTTTILPRSAPRPPGYMHKRKLGANADAKSDNPADDANQNKDAATADDKGDDPKPDPDDKVEDPKGKNKGQGGNRPGAAGGKGRAGGKGKGQGGKGQGGKGPGGTGGPERKGKREGEGEGEGEKTKTPGADKGSQGSGSRGSGSQGSGSSEGSNSASRYSSESWGSTEYKSESGTPRKESWYRKSKHSGGPTHEIARDHLDIPKGKKPVMLIFSKHKDIDVKKYTNGVKVYFYE